VIQKDNSKILRTTRKSYGQLENSLKDAIFVELRFSIIVRNNKSIPAVSRIPSCRLCPSRFLHAHHRYDIYAYIIRYTSCSMEAIQDAVTTPGKRCSLVVYWVFGGSSTRNQIYYFILCAGYMYIVAIHLYILSIPVLSTDISTELYAGIFRCCANRIEKSMFPATPLYCTLQMTLLIRLPLY